MAGYIQTLSQKLGDILKEKACIRYVGAYKSGRLLGKNVFKVITGSNRLFSKRNHPDKPNYVISMLLDESGSMSGSRHYNSYIASHLIMRACQKLGFQIKFIKYGSRVEPIEKLDEYRRMEGGGNVDSLALRHVIKNIDPPIFALLKLYSLVDT